MKLGPLYMLWTKNWQQKMDQMEIQGRELTELRSASAQMERELTQLRPVSAQVEQQGRELTELREALDKSRAASIDPPTPPFSRRGMIEAMDGWSTQWELDGQTVGGPVGLSNDPRVAWQIDAVGGVAGKRVLELGPLEGGHTSMLCSRGVGEVVAIEGLRRCWLRCLVSKEVFGLHQARFLYGDFCRYVAEYDGPPFDIVLALGILYHQRNPARLIRDLARITDNVFVWSQVASDRSPGGPEATVEVDGAVYRGRINNYGDARNSLASYCGGIEQTAIWLFPDDLRRAFRDAGFTELVEVQSASNPHGDTVEFVASRKPPKFSSTQSQGQN